MRRGPVSKGSTLIDSTSLFSAPEEQYHRSVAPVPAPATNPFQAPDFGNDEASVSELPQPPAPRGRAARSKAA
ncbi:hypothetical protein ICC28_23005 [Streptomyces sp. TRM68416]|nr:hypothetical protein [Streptomyces sp. TRM68416]